MKYKYKSFKIFICLVVYQNMFSNHTYELLGISRPITTTLSYGESSSADEDLEAVSRDFEVKEISNEPTPPLTNIVNAVPNTKKRRCTPKPKGRAQIVEQNEYDLMFEKTWQKSLTAVNNEFETYADEENPVNEMLKDFICSMQVNGDLYSALKKLLATLFTNTKEEFVHTTFKDALKLDFHTLISNIRTTYKSTIPDLEMLKGLHVLLQHLYSIGKCYESSSPKNDSYPPLKEEKDNLYYVIGYIINKLLNHKSSSEAKKVGNILIENDFEKVPIKFRKWVERQDRGALKYATAEAIEVFENIQRHVGSVYNEIYQTDKARKATELIQNDKAITDKWASIAIQAGVSEDFINSVKCMFIRKYINTIGKGHTNKLRNYKKEETRKKQLQTKFKTKEKNKLKIIEEVKKQLSYKHKIVL